MKRNPAVVATAVALGIAGCGSEAESGGAALGNGTDRAFVAAMIPHHESAVKMAGVAASRAESDFVKQLAADITASQTEEISAMRKEDEQLAKAGIKPGKLGVEQHMPMEDDTATLQNAKPFDEAFIKLMIPHHEGAVEMAQEELEQGSDPELKELAQNIIDDQKREIEAMIEHAKGGTDTDHGSDHG